MLIFFITGLSPVKDTFPVTVPALASSTAVGAPAAVFVGSDFGASEVSGDLPHPARSSSEAALQAIRNFFIFLSLSLNYRPAPEPALARSRLSSSGVNWNMYLTNKSAWSFG